MARRVRGAVCIVCDGRGMYHSGKVPCWCGAREQERKGGKHGSTVRGGEGGNKHK